MYILVGVNAWILRDTNNTTTRGVIQQAPAPVTNDGGRKTVITLLK